MVEPYEEVRAQREDAWMEKAACADDDPYLYDERYDRRPPSNVRCFSGCVVRAQCFTFAVRHGFEGVWGGTTHKQRKLLQRRQSRVRCPGSECGGTHIQRDGGRATCASCGLSWPTTQSA
jgi:hypothetical protein